MVSKNELGRLKQEYFVKEVIFISGKLNCIVLEIKQLYAYKRKRS